MVLSARILLFSGVKDISAGGVLCDILTIVGIGYYFVVFPTFSAAFCNRFELLQVDGWCGVRVCYAFFPLFCYLDRCTGAQGSFCASVWSQLVVSLSYLSGVFIRKL